MGYFPTQRKLAYMNRADLSVALIRNGGNNYFRELLGYNLLEKPKGYWFRIKVHTGDDNINFDKKYFIFGSWKPGEEENNPDKTGIYVSFTELEKRLDHIMLGKVDDKNKTEKKDQT